MEYKIKVNEAKNKDSNMKGFATVVFGDSFKITNIAVIKNSENGKLFVSMPRYKSNERDENGMNIYKDICNPITAEFRQELYGSIIEAFEKISEADNRESRNINAEMPQFSVSVTPFEKEGSNLKGFARIYFDDCFIVNNVNILQGRENIFIAMPSYKTKQVDENGKAVYQDICYPVTKEFREKLFGEIAKAYEEAIKREPSEMKANALEKRDKSDKADKENEFVKADRNEQPTFR